MITRCANNGCSRDGEPREIRDAARICRPCTDRFGSHLADLAHLHTRLAGALRPWITVKTTTGGGGRPDLIRLDVVEHRAEIHNWLGTEVRMWHDDLALVGWPTDTPAAMAAWLRVHVGRARHKEWVDTSAEAAQALRGRARALCDLPRERARIVLGPCPEHGIDQRRQPVPCPGTVHAHVPADHDQPLLARCDTCTTEWDAQRWHRLGRRMLALRV